VIEMAMQGKGQIRQLAKICLPDVAVVTNIGLAHLKQLKTRKNIALAKSEIFEALNKDCFAVINRDDGYFGLMQKKAALSKAKIVTFGIVNGSDISAEDIGIKANKISFILTRKNNKIRVKLGVPGDHNIYNAMASAAAAIALNIGGAKIQKGLSKTVFSGKRLEITKGKGNTTIINDTYNSNPSSMRAAINTLSSLVPVKTDMPFKRIAVLGDMLELGVLSKKAHEDIGKEAASSGIDVLIAAGGKSKDLYLGAKKLKAKSRSGFECYYFSDKASAAKKLKDIIKRNDIVLYKASRGMRFEDLIRT
ncbi:MAG: UDP-N-acetylmuramoyl-tripeptide--D-alanyl-D-alanine ligase, partial [Candidatus Margulisiibacteriota bacterium]